MAADYGNYTPQDFDEYVEEMIGDYGAQPECSFRNLQPSRKLFRLILPGFDNLNVCTRVTRQHGILSF